MGHKFYKFTEQGIMYTKRIYRCIKGVVGLMSPHVFKLCFIVGLGATNTTVAKLNGPELKMKAAEALNFIWYRGISLRNQQVNDGVNKHDDVIKWKHFPRYWLFVRRIHRLPVDSPHKGQWREALMFFLWCTSEQTVEQTVEMLVIWDTMALLCSGGVGRSLI